MTSNALQLVNLIFTQSWRLFTSWKIPGTNITPALWYCFLVASALIFAFARFFLTLSYFPFSGAYMTARSMYTPQSTALVPVNNSPVVR